MQKEFTKQFAKDNCGCYKSTDLWDGSVDYSKLLRCSFMQKETITLRDVMESEIPLRDKYWFLCKVLATKEENVAIACFVAETVLPIYERKYPDNKAPREAIEAAKQFIAGHITLEQLRVKRAAAYAAADAAAAAAAYAAADAAAYAAADDAAAAAAAYAAADDAAAADDDDEIKSKLEEYLLTFC